MFAWGISPPEAAVLCVLAVLLFGRRLPEIASSVGRSLRVFQESWRGVENDVSGLGRSWLVPPHSGTSTARAEKPGATSDAPPST